MILPPLRAGAAIGVLVLQLVGCAAVVPPDRSAMPSAAASAAPFVPSKTPSPTASVGPTDKPTEAAFEVPLPICPAPSSAVVVPDVAASIGGGRPVMTTHGSSGFATCSTSAVSDVVPTEPRTALAARPGDLVELTVPADWVILRWAGSDRPAIGEGANVWPAQVVVMPGRQIDVPAPARGGDSIASYTLWLKSADGHVVGSLDVLLRILVARS